jgi:hypothetical protein
MAARVLLFLAIVPAYSREPNVAQIVKTYTAMRKHPAIFDSKAGWKQWMEPALVEALISLRDTGNETSLRALLREEVSGVYSFKLFNDEFCDMFLEELDNYYASGLPVYRPNSMNNVSHARSEPMPPPPADLRDNIALAVY